MRRSGDGMTCDLLCFRFFLSLEKGPRVYEMADLWIVLMNLLSTSSKILARIQPPSLEPIPYQRFYRPCTRHQLPPRHSNTPHHSGRPIRFLSNRRSTPSSPIILTVLDNILRERPCLLETKPRRGPHRMIINKDPTIGAARVFQGVRRRVRFPWARINGIGGADESLLFFVVVVAFEAVEGVAAAGDGEGWVCWVGDETVDFARTPG